MSPGFWTRNLWVTVLASVVLAGGILAWSGQAGHGRSLAKQAAEIAKLETELERRRQAEAKAVDENASRALGVTATRLQDDEAIITSLLSTAFTWDSGEAYERARASLKSKYGLAEDEEFLQDLIPPALSTQGGKGDKHYLFDERGMRARFGGDREIAVVKVTGTKYRYAVVAGIVFQTMERATHGRGEKSADLSQVRRVLLWVTVDGAGAVSDLSGVPAAGKTRTSQ